MKLKYMAFVLVVLSFVFVAGCTSSNAAPEPSVVITVVPSYLPVPSYYPVPSYVPTEAPQRAPVSFTGHGTQSTDLFHLDAGLATFEMKNNAEDTLFQAFLYDDKGTYVDIIANTLSDTSIKHNTGIKKSGNYYVSFNTQNGWEIKISQ